MSITKAFINKQDSVTGTILVGTNGKLNFAKKVKGYRVYFPGLESYNFFVHKVHAGPGYCISELSTGLRIPAMLYDGSSYDEALRLAAASLECIGLEKFTEIINKTLTINDRGIMPEI